MKWMYSLVLESFLRIIWSWTSWSLKVGPIGCPKTSVRNYHSTLRNISEECRSYSHQAGQKMFNYWNARVYLCFEYSPKLDPVMSQLDSLTPSHPVSLIKGCDLCSGLRRGLFPSGFIFSKSALNILFLILMYLICLWHVPSFS